VGQLAARRSRPGLTHRPGAGTVLAALVGMDDERTPHPPTAHSDEREDDVRDERAADIGARPRDRSLTGGAGPDAGDANADASSPETGRNADIDRLLDDTSPR
jgi:hypothetical protein